MSKSKTLTLQSQIGLNFLSEELGKIRLTQEVTDLLVALDAELTISFVAGADQGAIRIVSQGKNICSLSEFQALSGYRRFIGETIKKLDKEQSSTRKIELISFFLREAKKKVTVPERILEQNLSKFSQFGSLIPNVLENLEALTHTVSNEWKKYLLENGDATLRILYEAQLSCMGTDAVPSEFVDENLFKFGIPKWVFNKFIDKNFTANVKNDCVSLLFPKNNYLKGIALMRKEIMNDEFLNKNKLVLNHSLSIISMAKADFSGLFPKYDDTLDEAVEEYLDKYMWVLTNPYSPDELLSIRETGKMAPVFRDAMPASGRGRTYRPETELAKTCRSIGNILGRIQGTWNGFKNLVVISSNPVEDFWQLLYKDADSWALSPTNSLYQEIRKEGIKPLETIRNNSSEQILERIASIIAQTLSVPCGTDKVKTLKGFFKSLKDDGPFKAGADLPAALNVVYKMNDMKGMETNPPVEAEIVSTKIFLGIKAKKEKAARMSSAGSRRVNTAVLDILSPLRNKPIYDPIINWIMTTFKTGKTIGLQVIAAERILGEALKYEDIIFPEEDVYEALKEIEDEESDDE